MGARTVTLLLALSTPSAFAQGTFQNLGFESATIVPIVGDPYGRIQFSPAFPSWTGTIGGQVQTNALYNNLFLGNPGIALLNSGWFSPPIEGNFSVALQAISGSGGNVSTALSQTGLVPFGSLSIQLKVMTGVTNPLSLFAVSFAGENVSLTPINIGPNYTLYGGDISRFAGQNGQLNITAVLPPPNLSPSVVYLDSITFSPNAVPEPGVSSLFALVTALFSYSLVRRYGKQMRSRISFSHSD